MRKRSSITFFALAIVFISMTVVFYEESGISLAKYLIFILGGFVAGSMFTRGLLALKSKNE
ncbi:MAG: hypothetical protein A2W99_11655 [Bacteroidetes bacterium GWF2_33_16]|nr:MAG: hypothetical protein A2X00_02620 [Bacteroidetes bacterium GWE2_32_14]OFY06356.1 MAG: hypothetical protein A2W99_11655 [Bacteroidetes bacterium GWF2_33_16]